jgi:diaminopimelate epimerase
MRIPFWKAHGAGNDFLFTFAEEAVVPESRMAQVAVAICDRRRGIGADGWYWVEPSKAADARIRLFNSDGSRAELSANGSRCAAALLVATGRAGDNPRIETGAGVKAFELKGIVGSEYRFAMDAGLARVVESNWGPRGAVVLDVGNPQCAVPVSDLDFDWRAVGREIEADPHFPARTNVSFFRRADDHAIEARFYERGAGPTLSSGTGSIGAALAAIHLGIVHPPVRVATEGGDLLVDLSVESALDSRVRLVGPAELVGRGQFGHRVQWWK